MQDTIDLIPIGGFYGKGKRQGTIGAYLMACYNKETGHFESICKVGTGLKDEDLQALSEHFKDKTLKEKPSCYLTNQSSRLQPDIWFLPNDVWEIEADSITRSPSNIAAKSLMSN